MSLLKMSLFCNDEGKLKCRRTNIIESSHTMNRKRKNPKMPPTNKTNTHPAHTTTALTIPQNPIPRAIYDRIAEYVNTTANYGPLRGKAKTQFKNMLHWATHDANHKITFEAALSIRHALVMSKSVSSHPRMMKEISNLRRLYSTGTDIMTLSTRHDYPPIALLRAILNAPPTTPRDVEQYKIATRNDDENPAEIARRATIAQTNEDIFVDLFRKIPGLSMKTQSDLVAEQVAEYGRAILTPDILFLSPVTINGIRVNWIDFKDYTGTPSGVLYNSNVRQAEKYAVKWGPGAMMYRQNYVSGMDLYPAAVVFMAPDANYET